MTTALATAPVRRQTLFDVAADLLALNDLLDELGGDVSDPTVEKSLDAWFADVAQAEAAKLAGYVGLIHLLDMEAAAAKEHAEAFAAKARTRLARVRWLKERLRDYLTVTGRTKATTADGYTVAVQKNGGKPPLNVDESLDLDRIDSRFVRTQKVLDTAAVFSALESGESLPFARLLPVGTHLRIR